MPRVINHDLMRRQCVEQHGEILGTIVFEQRLAAATRQLDILEEFERKRAALQTEYERVLAALPDLEPLRQAMAAAYTVWLDACAALETQRIRNQSALMPLQAQIGAIATQIAESGSPARVEPWKKIATNDPPYIESPHDEAMRRQHNARRHG